MDHAQPRLAEHPTASMEPRLGGRGNIRPRSLSSQGEPSFNGATAWRPWKPSTSPMARRRATRFNGATARRPWKRRGCSMMMTWSSGWLQWSHGSEAVETWTPEQHAEVKRWLQWSHGSEAVETRGSAHSPRRQRCFNGATARRPWKPPYGQKCGRGWRSFNGATARRPWKRMSRSGKDTSTGPLQWSHGSEAVETRRPGSIRAGIPLLQWSHGSEAVETRSRDTQTRATEGLQWSHGSEAVETAGREST